VAAPIPSAFLFIAMLGFLWSPGFTFLICHKTDTLRSSKVLPFYIFPEAEQENIIKVPLLGGWGPAKLGKEYSS